MASASRSFFFGMTLSEIGFILFFALLIFAFHQQQQDKEHLEEANKGSRAAENRIASLEAVLREKEDQLANASATEKAAELMRTIPDERMDDVFERLIPALEAEAKVDALRSENAALRTELTEYVEVRDRLASMVSELNDRSSEELSESLAICDSLMQQGIDAEDVADPRLLLAAKELTKAIEEERGTGSSNSFENLDEALEEFLLARNALDNCEGQVANLTRRINVGGGRDLPPCWASRDGRVEYLFAIIIRDDGLIISSAAPESRIREYARIPNVDQLTSDAVTLEAFKKLAHPILEDSDTRQCRHYVTITDRSEFSYKATLTIEDYFYKYVNRS